MDYPYYIQARPKYPNPVERSLRHLSATLLTDLDPRIRVRYWKRPYGYKGWTWNGWYLVSSGSGVIEGMHDVAHCLVASPDRLHVPEWGLGMDPAGWADYPDGQRPPELLSKKAIHHEELLACDMHWCLVAYGYPKAHLPHLAGDLYRIEAYLNMEPVNARQLQRLEDKFSHVVPGDFFEVVRQRKTWMKENRR
jgi:hypothetical protein